MKKFSSEPHDPDRFISKESIGRPRAPRLEGVVKNRGIRNVKKPKGVRGS